MSTNRGYVKAWWDEYLRQGDNDLLDYPQTVQSDIRDAFYAGACAAVYHLFQTAPPYRRLMGFDIDHEIAEYFRKAVETMHGGEK